MKPKPKAKVKTIDIVTFAAGNHLTYTGANKTFCGQERPYWYRLPWDRDRLGVCRKCLKKLDQPGKDK